MHRCVVHPEPKGIHEEEIPMTFFVVTLTIHFINLTGLHRIPQYMLLIISPANQIPALIYP